MASSSAPLPASGSCWQRALSCLTSKETAQSAKVGLYFIGGAASGIIPIPFLNGFLANAFFFQGFHAIMPFCTNDRELQSIATSRSWKHLLLGTVISGAGGGLGELAFEANILTLAAFGQIVGLGSGLKAAYSDRIFRSNNAYAPLPHAAPPALPLLAPSGAQQSNHPRE